MSKLWHGFNFGNWLSQSSLEPPHIETFYAKKDVSLIKDWGFNFVRLPVDYMFFENDNAPGVYDESRLKYVDKCISWCKKYDVHVNLDLHHAPGYGVLKMLEASLWTNEEQLKRTEKIWRMFAKRYAREGDCLSFNLINEPFGVDMTTYQKFVKRMISAIREHDPERLIIVDGNSLARIPVPDIEEPNVGQSFHCYEPMWVTHLGAEWVHAMYIYKENPEYPGKLPNVEKYVEKSLSPVDKWFFEMYKDVYCDKTWIEKAYMPWFEFSQKTGTFIYCGEMGTYTKRISRKSQLNWYRDVFDIFKKHDVDWALWNLRGTFGVIDTEQPNVSMEKLPDGRFLDRELLELLQSYI
jgi:aryl-phospho-beta-D-glucosidase BglC (GH1 family)